MRIRRVLLLVPLLLHRLEQELSRTMGRRCSSARLGKEVNGDDVEVLQWIPGCRTVQDLVYGRN